MTGKGVDAPAGAGILKSSSRALHSRLENLAFGKYLSQSVAGKGWVSLPSCATILPRE
jgi:hypothetical protein